MYSLTTAEAAAVGGIVAGIVSTFLLVGLVLWALLVVAHWKMFTKAGEAGWKSIIPIYSDYISYKIAWDTTNFWIMLALSAVGSLLTGLGSSVTVSAAGEIVSTGGNPILATLGSIVFIAALVWEIRLMLKTARAFGKGTGFGVGLVLLPNIFTLILGFGSAEYVGPQE